jgi:hypothetical protein
VGHNENKESLMHTVREEVLGREEVLMCSWATLKVVYL